jgi:site-specific recombinase XerD
MTRFGVHRVVTTCAVQAQARVETMRGKHVSPHTLRHTTAVHLLRAQWHYLSEKVFSINGIKRG